MLQRRIRRTRPQMVALVGVTLYRALFPERASDRSPVIGLRAERLSGAAVFVLPNPSGRNANFSYDEMRAAFEALASRLA
jgi:TDG/mug DNA glycosylase family protein